MKYHNINKDDFLNGDGIRAVLFVSGCTHHCPECHNPITWNKNAGLKFDDAAKKELFEYLEKDYVSGITFSGGDPLAIYNRDEVLALINEIKEKFPNKTVWVYTGWTKEELQQQGFWDKLADKIDVIVEGKFDINKKQISYHWAGSTNQRVLRKESNFEINTSDKYYILLEDLKNECAAIKKDSNRNYQIECLERLLQKQPIKEMLPFMDFEEVINSKLEFLQLSLKEQFHEYKNILRNFDRFIETLKDDNKIYINEIEELDYDYE